MRVRRRRCHNCRLIGPGFSPTGRRRALAPLADNHCQRDHSVRVPGQLHGNGEAQAQRPAIVIDKVLQQAFVEVDEVGTEAAAVTAVVMVVETAAVEEPEPVVFHAEHPFAYVIRDRKTGVVLFAGRMSHP